MGCIWITFFKFISVYIKMTFTQLENHSHLLCGRDFANERLFLCQIDKIGQHFLKERDLAPLSNACWSVIPVHDIEKVMIQGNLAGGLIQ